MVTRKEAGVKMKIKELLENINVDLFEIDMSPSGLSNAVKSIDALAGMEFELCVPSMDPDEDDDDNYGSPTGADAIGADFESYIGRNVIVSDGYHGARRDGRSYIVEPDGSINPSRGGLGLEFVSPPMSISAMLSDFDKVVKWCRMNGAYTNNSTGLHMNVSIRGMGTKEDGAGSNTLDYVKLAILLGDRYVLDQFGRLGNSYAVSAMEKIEALVDKKPEKVLKMLDLMRGHLDHMASLMIHSGSSKKYTSINTKSGYIEFRSPGGDWLGNPKLIEAAKNSLLRFVVALDAANDPNKYRQEYLKKLYALLSPAKDDSLNLFWQYNTGKISKQQFINTLRARNSNVGNTQDENQ